MPRPGLARLALPAAAVLVLVATVALAPPGNPVAAASSATAGAAKGGGTTAPFAAQVTRVTTAEIHYLWHPGCPVGASSLRMVHMRYWGFDARPHMGWMVVNAAVTRQLLTVFARLYDARFPIRRMVTEEAFHGSDPASMAADNTSGFNCRYAVAPGPSHWSAHAYGEAVDVNTVENPYVEGSVVQPAAGAAYLDRADYRPGMAVRGGELVEAFASVGWYWGGRWTASPDYQHFSLTGG